MDTCQNLKRLVDGNIHVAFQSPVNQDPLHQFHVWFLLTCAKITNKEKYHWYKHRTTWEILVLYNLFDSISKRTDCK